MLSEPQVLQYCCLIICTGFCGFSKLLTSKANSLKCFIDVCECVHACEYYIHLGLLSNHTESNLLLHSSELGREAMRE